MVRVDFLTIASLYYLYLVSLYGKNLTDEIYRTQQVSLNDYWNQGRTWGGSITYSF